MDEECCEVVVTAADADWLAGFTRTLVEERLAACGHVIDADPLGLPVGGRGARRDRGAGRAAHPPVAGARASSQRTQELHPYDIPCVIALSLTGGNPDYLRWIVDETRAA